MNDYKQVQEALKNGVAPEHLCMTCPWDRFCITPPEMTADEVEAKIEKAKADDETRELAARERGEKGGLPVGMLLTALTVSGRDTSSKVCPVLAMTLRTSDGRAVVDLLKAHMQHQG